MRPFVILALPRTGTKMFCSAVHQHRGIPSITHEFKGTEQEFRAHPAVLSNYLKPWMLHQDIVKIHLHREDAVAGGLSMLLLQYTMPDGLFDVPVDEVEAAAKYRRKLDAEFAAVADISISYEEITGGESVSELPFWIVTGKQPIRHGVLKQ